MFDTMASMITEYLVAFANQTKMEVKPIGLVLDGPLVQYGSMESSCTNVLLKMYQIVPQLYAQQKAIEMILNSRNRCVITLSGIGSTAILGTFNQTTFYRTVMPNSSIIVSIPVRVMAEQCQLESNILMGEHEIDIEGCVKLVIDQLIVHLYLLNGTLYLNGELAAVTEHSEEIENASQQDNQIQTYSTQISPALKSRDHLLTKLDRNNTNKNPKPIKPISLPMKESKAKQVRLSLGSRFQFNPMIPNEPN